MSIPKGLQTLYPRTDIDSNHFTEIERQIYREDLNINQAVERGIITHDDYKKLQSRARNHQIGNLPQKHHSQIPNHSESLQGQYLEPLTRYQSMDEFRLSLSSSSSRRELETRERNPLETFGLSPL